MGIILIIAIVGLAVWLLSQNHEMGKGVFATANPAKVESALEILRKRYASGDIDRDEYETRRRDLAGV